MRGCMDKIKVMIKPAGALALPYHLRHKACLAAPQGVCTHGCGCSSGVEHDLAKVGVEGSNPFARSKFSLSFEKKKGALSGALSFCCVHGANAVTNGGRCGSSRIRLRAPTRAHGRRR